MKIKCFNYLAIALIAVLAGCKGSDFVISSPVTTEQTAVEKIQSKHDDYNKVSCVECHESNRPQTKIVHGDNRNCVECHSAVRENNKLSWKKLIKFDHTVKVESCTQCHQTKMPQTAPHGADQVGNQNDCIQCHSTNSWNVTKFNHEKMATNDCNQCHLTSHRDSRPKNEQNHPAKGYEKVDCYQCHIAKEPAASWKDLKFNQREHSPKPNSCIACHDNQRPLAHKQNPTVVGMDKGECNLCHGSTIDWKTDLKKFNHKSGAPTSCMSCHQQDAPDDTHPSKLGNYTKLDCALCHTYQAEENKKPKWYNLTFDQRDHSPTPGSCKTCHQTVNDSRPETKSHEKLSRANNDCQTCHAYDSEKKWKNISKFNHNKIEAGETCESCHNPENKILKSKSQDHVPTKFACVECHKTEGWKPATYKHATGDTNCLSCHNGKVANDAPVSHKLSVKPQCSTCHNQTEWKDVHYDQNFVHPESSLMHQRKKGKETLYHKKQNDCLMCHDSKSNSVKYKFNYGVSCASCHEDKARTNKIHVFEGIKHIRNCIMCHTYSKWEKVFWWTK